MLDPRELYELTANPTDLQQPVMIHTLTGFLDAASVVRIARDHLLRPRGPLPEAPALSADDSHETPVPVAVFDVDQLLDYRSRRPTLHLSNGHLEYHEPPVLQLTALRDAAGNPYLLLSGPEPSLQWERFTAAVLGLVDQFDVRMTVGVGAVPLAVPHTRPIDVTAHATRRELISAFEPWFRQVKIPASVSGLLELRLGERGRDAVGFAAHVPHYLAQAEYPSAAERVLTCVAEVTGLELPLGSLHAAAELVEADLDHQLGQAQEIAALVHALEQQYDARARERQTPRPGDGSVPIPTADELGAELERFLADQNDPGDPSAGA